MLKIKDLQHPATVGLGTFQGAGVSFFYSPLSLENVVGGRVKKGE
jgi:hypothetical protein